MSNTPQEDSASTAGSTARVAVAQLPVTLGDVAANTDSAVRAIEECAKRGVDLVVLPECFLSGYMFTSEEETRAASVGLDSPALTAVADACVRGGVHAVVGAVEADGPELYNTAFVVTPDDGVIGRYRKLHLPVLGADRFVTAGAPDQHRVFSTAVGRIGVMICFDLRFPECARVLALQGADVIASPTAWPHTATRLADVLTRARALENVVHLVVADRADEERGTTFLGRSQVVGPEGDVLLDAGTAPGVHVVDVDVAAAGTKDLVYTPGEYEVPLLSGRRPDAYGPLTT